MARKTDNGETPKVEALLLRPREVAVMLGCSLSQVYDLIERGELPSIRLRPITKDSPRPGVRVPRAELMELLAHGVVWGNQTVREAVRKETKKSETCGTYGDSDR